MFQNIPLDEIDPNPDQPRAHFAGIEELAESIRVDGLLEPVMVRPFAGRYQIVHGERRYRASKLAGLSELPAVVREMDDTTMFRLSLVENVQRAALTPMEEAVSFARLQKQGHTQAEIGRIIGKGQSYVAHKLRLLKVSRPLTYYLEVGALTENHLR
ncbi:MAG: ParB/RepB/Spo0J family partition protein [Actinomycetota bacterium]|nr:ParB/RepB/Spo0J family partition protein [Actinomycetota bacterium]